ncbi:MAG: WD40 repeat domain-containing protein [Myxococcota bacterium]|jgi:WD40 repeat protein|nr:WD40 repeat domain-containing protein [Myxococcota bacterium]
MSTSPAAIEWPASPLAVELVVEAELGAEVYGPRLAFAPQGDRWAASSSGVVELFLGSHHEARIVVGGSTHDLAFSPDGRLLLASPQLYDLVTASWQELPPLFPAVGRGPAPPFQTQVSTFSPGAELLLVYARFQPRRQGGPSTVQPSRRLLLLDGRTRRLRATFWEGDDPARHFSALALAGRFAAAACEDVWVWELASGRELLRLKAHAGYVQQLRFAREAALLLSAGLDGRVNLWDTRSWQTVATWSAHPARADAVALHPLRPLLVTGSRDGELKLWQLHPAPRLLQTAPQPGPIEGVTFSADGRLLAVAVGGARGKLLLLRVEHRP